MDHSMPEESGFQAEVRSSLEPKIIEKVCKPLLELIPESVHPNTISLINHLLAWTTASLAAVSVQLTPAWRLLALLGAGVGMFMTLVADCLDGMQARRTNRCSKLGEMLDHWLDAIHVPLTTLGICVALEFEPWAVVAVHVTNTMIYNSQLVLYHYRGNFIHPDMSGVDAQLGVSLGYAGMGVFFFFFDRNVYWVDVMVAILAATAVITHLRLNYFYYIRLKGMIVHHLPFVLLCCGFGGLYLLGIIDTIAFLLCVVFISFRITGGYVENTILKRRFSGFDIGICLWIVAIAGIHYCFEKIQIGDYSLDAILPYLACLYMVSRNLIGFFRHYSELKPASSERF